MSVENKAHTATVRRVAQRYHASINTQGNPDVSNGKLVVEVETSATISRGIKVLTDIAGPVFVAVTNREALVEALRKASRTRVGVMDPQGEIVKQSDPPFEGIATHPAGR